MPSTNPHQMVFIKTKTDSAISLMNDNDEVTDSGSKESE